MNVAIIIAGGKGKRMGESIPKQFIKVYGKPIIIYTLEVFERHPSIDAIEVVCIDEYEKILKKEAKKYNITKLKWVVTGGETCQESIRNGVYALENICNKNDKILLHMSVNPLVSDDLITDCLDVCNKYGNAVSSEDVLSYTFLKDDEKSSSSYIPREKIKLLTMPQAYKFEKIIWAYKKSCAENIGTGETSYANTLMVDLGEKIYFSKASPLNIKITTKEDIEKFKAFLLLKKKRKKLMKKYLVGIDEGTTGTKTCVFDENGCLISSSYCEYPSYYPEQGYVEQNIDEIESAVFSTCKDAIKKANVENENIIAVSLSTQGAASIFVDKNGSKLRKNMIGWQDLRHLDYLKNIKNEIEDKEHYNILGAGIGAFNTANYKWIQENEPEVWANVYKCCSNQDYFLKILGAEDYYIDTASAHRLSMLDVENCCWDLKLSNAYGVKKSQLPIIVKEAGKIVGEVTDEVSKKTGLPAGCKICVGAIDLNCSSFASGGINGDIAVMVVGTFGGSYIVTEKPYRDPNQAMILKVNQGMNNWQIEAFSHTAASAFRWFRDRLCSLEVATSKLIGVDPYSLMTEIATNSVPGSNGITALTCLQGSHGRNINENMRGTILGINLSTDKSDIAHAILEGICFEMYDILLMQEEAIGEVKSIRLSGGVTNSPMWCQMFADITEKPIELTTICETGCLGAAMYAGIGTGLYKDAEDAVEKCVHIKKTYNPNSDNYSKYREAFNKWKCAFKALNGSLYQKPE